MTRSQRNLSVLIVVVGVVGGVAWLRSRSETEPASDASAPPAGIGETAMSVAGEGAADGSAAALAADAAPPDSAAAGDGQGLPRMIDLGADQCQACKALAPIIEELSRELAGRATIQFIDVWKNPRAGQDFGIRLIPTQVFYDRSGREVYRHEGFFSKEEILAKLEECGL